jgi:hypothetical protein
MRGAIPPLPNTPSWRGVQLKHRDNFTFTFKVSEVHLSRWLSTEQCSPMEDVEEMLHLLYNSAHGRHKPLRLPIRPLHLRDRNPVNHWVGHRAFVRN